MKREEGQIGQDPFLKIMQNMDMVNLQQEIPEDKSYTMIVKMQFIFQEFHKISKMLSNFGVITGKVLKKLKPSGKNVYRESKIYKEQKYIKTIQFLMIFMETEIYSLKNHNGSLEEMDGLTISDLEDLITYFLKLRKLKY